jgi:hypothetical protein
VRPDPGVGELTFPDYENGTLSSTAAATMRSMKHSGKGPGGRVLRQCGVPDPSRRETIMTLKVLDAWEAESPGRRQRLLDQMRESRRQFRQLRLKQEEVPLAANGTNGTTTTTTSTNGTNVTIIDANGTTVGNETNATVPPNGTIAKNLVVKVWFHNMRAGNTPALGVWTRPQARRSVQLANYYFAHSPILFKFMGITQTVNADWFQCKFDKDYATGTCVCARLRETNRIYDAGPHSTRRAISIGSNPKHLFCIRPARTLLLLCFDQSELQYKTFLRRVGADTLNVYMCDLRRGQGLWGYASFPSALKDWAVYDGIVLANPFTLQDGSTCV